MKAFFSSRYRKSSSSKNGSDDSEKRSSSVGSHHPLQHLESLSSSSLPVIKPPNRPPPTRNSSNKENRRSITHSKSTTGTIPREGSLKKQDQQRSVSTSSLRDLTTRGLEPVGSAPPGTPPRIYLSRVNSNSVRSLLSPQKEDLYSVFSDDIRSFTSGSERIVRTDDVIGHSAANRSPKVKPTKPENINTQPQRQTQSYSSLLSSNSKGEHQSSDTRGSSDKVIIDSKYKDLSRSISSLKISDSSSNTPRLSKSPKQSFDYLNDENYDTSVLKIGWLNRSHGEILSTVPLSHISSSNNNDAYTITIAHNNSNGNDSGNSSNNDRAELSPALQRDSKFFGTDSTLHLQRSITTEGDISDYIDSRGALKVGVQSIAGGGGNSSSSSSSTNNSSNIVTGETSIMVPDYRVYKAELKGCLLNLYKHGLGSSVKYFEPVELNESRQQQQQYPHQQLEFQVSIGTQSSGGNLNNRDIFDDIGSETSGNHSVNQKKRSTISGLGMISRIENSKSGTKFTPSIELKYLCEDFPHPELKLDKDGRIIGGSVESLCHTILFSPFESSHDITSSNVGESGVASDGKAIKKDGENNGPTRVQRHVVNLTIILPLINNFGKFLGVLNQIGLVFTSKDEKLSSTLPQYHHIPEAVDEEMTERLGLVVRSIVDVLPSFLLDEYVSQIVFSLLSTISLHNETMGRNLKILVTNRRNELLLLISPLRTTEPNHNDAATVTSSTESNITSLTKFLSLDINDFTNAVHSINLKYDKVWSPCLDYSLLYSSKYMKQHSLRYCPLVFNNKENIHFLGRLLITHLFPSGTSHPVSAESRARALTNWVQIGCRFERLGDMVSWLAIATVICSIPVLRLYSVWKHVSEVTLKIIFREWVPTIIQLYRRQSSSRSTGSVFILAPPNLEDSFIKKNVISYFGDLVIYGDDLPLDTKFKYLERKIHRTRNAFHKWQERLNSLSSSQQADQLASASDQQESLEPKPELLDSVYSFWRYHISRPALNIKKIMELSLLHEPPFISPTPYVDSQSSKTPLSTGSYYPTVFNDPLPNYTIFPSRFLIPANELSEMGLLSGASGRTTFSHPSSGLSKKLSISEPIGVFGNRSTTVHTSETKDASAATITVDEHVAKVLSSAVPGKNQLIRIIRDFFNIDRSDLKVCDDLILKSYSDPLIKTGATTTSSTVASTPSRSPLMKMNSTQEGSAGEVNANVLTKALEDMDFMDSIDKVNDKPNETVIKVVIKYASLEKLFDMLVLPSDVFSRFVNPDDLEKYGSNMVSGTKTSGSSQKAMGILDYAFVKLVMDNDAFYETFFNTYKSFTSTLHVLENLGRRYVGARSCAQAMVKILDPSKSGDFNINEDVFPVWDAKVSKNSLSGLLQTAKIQTGVADALLYMVSNHYRDFTDDIKCNSTLLDILKIMEQEVSFEWPSMINRLRNDSTISVEYLEEVKSAVLKLEESYKFLKTNYHKQLYRPVGINKMQRRATSALETFNRLTHEDLLRLTSNEKLDDTLLSTFNKLHYPNYEDILTWVYQLNNLIAEYMKRVSKKQWYRTFEVLDMTSAKSVTAFFNYPLHSESLALIDSNSFQLKELEISNVFTFISTVTYKNNGSKEAKRLIQELPEPVQILLHLHNSLVSFFIVSVTNPAKEFRNRVEICAVLLQILNFCRKKNASLDLFETLESERDNTVCPHVPSFIETAISNAILSPECRYFELSWLSANRLLSASSINSPNPGEESRPKSIEDVLDLISTTHLEKFAEVENMQPNKLEYLSVCPGWLLCRLLEVSQCVSNFSARKHELIYFDKRRLVAGLVGMMHYTSAKVVTSPLDRAGYLLFNHFQDPDKTFRKAVKGTATAEAKLMRFQETGLFNSILIEEIEKCKRDGRKYYTLRVLERNSRESLELQQQFANYKQDPQSQSTSKLHSSTVMIGPNYSGNSVTSSYSSASVSKMKRGSTVSLSNRSSVIGTSNTSSGSVSKKIGGFFRRPFSIAGFNVSGNNYPSSSSSSSGYQQGQDTHLRKAIESTQLPILEKSSIPDSKPYLTIRTFEINKIVNILNFKNSPAYKYSFKIIMRDGREHVMQAINAEELHEWVRMINISRRYSFHSKAFKSKTSNRVFGIPLEDICTRESTTVPMIVTKLLNEIELRGLDEVGLYRVPGSIGSINALKNAFDVEGAINNSFTLSDEKWSEINVIAGCFKMYLRELPESLFSNDLVEEFSKLALRYRSLEIGIDEYKEQMKKLLAELPTCNYETIKRIVYHLNKVHQHEANNRMDASNLAIVFSMSFIDQEDLSTGMGPMLGGIQTVLQHFIRSPGEFFL